MIGVIRVPIARRRIAWSVAPRGGSGSAVCGMRCADHSDRRNEKGIGDMADKRYIDADKLTFSRVRIIHSDGTIGGWHAVVMSSVIKDAPAADVVEVVHGEWISVESDVIFKCSICDAEVSTSWDYEDDDMFKYCPCCGAKMDGERKEQT